jgi:hypothetical protein
MLWYFSARRESIDVLNVVLSTNTGVPVKLPSISQAAADARNTFGRFPFAIIDAFVGTICALILIDHTGPPEPTVLMQIIFGAALGFPLLAGLAIVSEKWKWGTLISLGVQLVGVVLVGLYSTTVPPDLNGAPAIHILQLLMLITGTVLFVFSAPYFKHESELGYWNYCKTLCLRILTGGLYAVVMWTGLAIALAALNNLFGVDIPSKRYAELWVLINGIFTTWFILAGVPQHLESLDSITDYPKGLKIFSQFILFPLVLVYLVILYAYLGKILLAWDWPQGWVSRLILGFIATGFTSLVLLHPISDRIENIWIKTVARWFYVIIIPLTVMLFLAVWQRVSEYGFTEGRYLGIATVVWLCVITPYFLFSKKKKILFLTTSLCAAVFVVSFGPWGMFAVSEKSQVNRLKELLLENHILVDGRVQPMHDSLHFATAQQISSIIGYLSEIHGLDAIQPWFAETLKRDSIGGTDAYKDPAHVAKLMGVQYVRTWRQSAGGKMILTADREGAMVIDGYERLLSKRHVFSGMTKREFSGEGIAVLTGTDLSTMTVTISRDMKTGDALRIDLKPLTDKLIAEYGEASTDRIPPEKMAIVVANQTTMVKVFFSTMEIQRHGGTSEVMSYDADIAYTYRD